MSMEGRGCGQRLKVLMAQSQESQELVPRLGTAGVKRSVGPYRPTQWHLGTNKDQTLGTGCAFEVWAEGCGGHPLGGKLGGYRLWC